MTKVSGVIWVFGIVGAAADGSVPNDVVEQFEIAIAEARLRPEHARSHEPLV